MFNMNLTSEQLEFRSMLREFVNEKVKIPALNSDRLQSFHKPILNQLLTEISELGLRSLSIPEELGIHNSICVLQAQIPMLLMVGIIPKVKIKKWKLP